MNVEQLQLLVGTCSDDYGETINRKLAQVLRAATNEFIRNTMKVPPEKRMSEINGEMRRICKEEGKVPAIKFIRNKLDLDLRGAKVYVEDNCANILYATNQQIV